jgi:hypothetical protein
MSAWASTAAHGRPPGRVRWPRRIAGVLGTAALLAVGVETVALIVPDSKPAQQAAAPVARAPSAKAASSGQAAKHRRPGLTKAQKRARASAVATLRTQGYEPVRVRDYDPRHKLRVLVGYRSGDPSGPRRAFFFVGGRMVGNDSSTPSSGLKISGSSKRWVTLAYGVYASGDQPCCPSAGHEKVRFEWLDGALQPVGGTIPASWQRLVSG